MLLIMLLCILIVLISRAWISSKNLYQFVHAKCQYVDNKNVSIFPNVWGTCLKKKLTLTNIKSRIQKLKRKIGSRRWDSSYTKSSTLRSACCIYPVLIIFLSAHSTWKVEVKSNFEQIKNLLWHSNFIWFDGYKCGQVITNEVIFRF